MLQVQNTGPRLKLAAGVTLEPGSNEVAETAWEKCLLNRMTQIFLESRMIQVVFGAAGVTSASESMHTKPVAPDAPVDPEPVLARDLVVAIKAETDMEYLRGLLEGERRTTVVIAINARLEALRRAAYEVVGDGED